jgi:hypothetical protein
MTQDIFAQLLIAVLCGFASFLAACVLIVIISVGGRREAD